MKFHFSDFNVKRIETGIALKLPRAKFPDHQNYTISINTSVFYSIQSIIYLIDNVEIVYLGSFFGLILLIKMGDNDLLVISNANTSKGYQFLRHAYLNYLKMMSDYQNEDGFYAILTGEFNYSPTGEIYRRELVAKVDTKVSTREEKASTLVKYFSNLFVIDEYKIMFENQNIASVLEIDDKSGNLIWKCSCPSIHDIYKCEHLLGCFYLAIENGWFYA